MLHNTEMDGWRKLDELEAQVLLHHEAPASTLYADLKSFGGISNKDAARILLSAKVTAGGKAPRDRIENRTYLSREIVHVSPKKVNPSIYGDLYGSTQTLCSLITKHLGGANASTLIAVHYAGEAADAMCTALVAHDLDDRLYRNECARLQRVDLRSEKDRHLLLFMLFCITGALSDVRKATDLVEDFAHHMLAMDLATVSVDFDGAMRDGGDLALGLLRLVGNAAEPPIMSLDPNGTVIGQLATGPNAIKNVGIDVSRVHARIWKEGARWLVSGLKSKNGTTLILGATNETISVEPPESKRARSVDYPPQEIHESDILCLGSSTRFLVLRVHANG